MQNYACFNFLQVAAFIVRLTVLSAVGTFRMFNEFYAAPTHAFVFHQSCAANPFLTSCSPPSSLWFLFNPMKDQLFESYEHTGIFLARNLVFKFRDIWQLIGA